MFSFSLFFLCRTFFGNLKMIPFLDFSYYIEVLLIHDRTYLNRRAHSGLIDLRGVLVHRLRQFWVDLQSPPKVAKIDPECVAR